MLPWSVEIQRASKSSSKVSAVSANSISDSKECPVSSVPGTQGVQQVATLRNSSPSSDHLCEDQPPYSIVFSPCMKCMNIIEHHLAWLLHWLRWHQLWRLWRWLFWSLVKKTRGNQKHVWPLWCIEICIHLHGRSLNQDHFLRNYLRTYALFSRWTAMNRLVGKLGKAAIVSKAASTNNQKM